MFRVRVKSVAEYLDHVPPCTAISVPCGMSLQEVMHQDCLSACHIPQTLATKARQCVEHDRRSDAVMRARG